MNAIWTVNVLLWTSFDHGYDLEREHFLSSRYGSEWVDEMSCRKGVWKFDTLCETTLWVRVKRHVTHHCLQTMHRGYVEGYCKKSWKIGREHSTYCGKNLVCGHPVSQYSISLRTCRFWHQDDVIDQCWPVIVVYGSVLHLILDSTWVWYSLLLELKIPTLAWHWNCLLRLRRWEGHSLQVMTTQL